jgi:biotin carboxyl carrier protein
MSNYYVSIGNREYNVKVTDSQVLLNGEPVNLDLVSLNENGLHLVCEGHHSREVYLGTHAAGVYEVISDGHRVIAKVNREHHQRHAAIRDQNAGYITAPMPGLVVELLVAEGDYVDEGQIVAVQESMKMQMQLKAPISGRIKHIAVDAGVQIGKDDLVMVLEQD